MKMKMTRAFGPIGGLAALCIAWGLHVVPFVFPGSLIGGAVGIAIGNLLFFVVMKLYKWVTEEGASHE